MALTGLKVLVVDDDQLIANLVAEFLNGLGCRATTCNDAAQALLQAEGLRPKLIITDINMPFWGTGVDAYRKIRAHRHIGNLPVIFMTSMTPKEAGPLMPQDPKVRLIFKPLDFPALKAVIAELTGVALEAPPPAPDPRAPRPPV